MSIDEHLQNIQESQMFADRRTEELNDSVLDLATQLGRLSDRLAVIESKIEALAGGLLCDGDIPTSAPDECEEGSS